MSILEDPDFTPRNVSKYAIKTAIHMKVAQVAKTALVEHTKFESNDITVRISTNVLGWAVSAQLQPLTDRMVDKVADFVTAKREARAAKKKETSEEK
jgi:hypothetical protein